MNKLWKKRCFKAKLLRDISCFITSPFTDQSPVKNRNFLTGLAETDLAYTARDGAKVEMRSLEDRCFLLEWKRADWQREKPQRGLLLNKYS